MSENITYKQVLTPDFHRITEIVLSAKGVERNMVQFSEACGINASTLSRLVNGKLKRPLSIDMIDAIIGSKCAACEFSTDDLLQANGMVDEATYERRYRNERPYQKMRHQFERLTAMRTILLSELYGRGVGFRKSNHSEITEGSVLNEIALMKSGTVLRMLESKNEAFWCLILNTLSYDELETNSVTDGGLSFGSFRRRMLAYFATLLLTDAWQPETMSDIKCSFVFCDTKVYDAFRDIFQNAKISSNLTTILLDLEAGKVIREEPVPGCKKHKQDHYFDDPIPETEEPFEDDFLSEMFDE